MTPSRLSPRLMSRFVETLSKEVGADTYHAVLSNSGLSRDWQKPEFFLAFDATQTAEAYSKLQSALRTYYGRGARGILLRIGSKLWEPMLNDAWWFQVRQLAPFWRRLHWNPNCLTAKLYLL